MNFPPVRPSHSYSASIVPFPKSRYVMVDEQHPKPIYSGSLTVETELKKVCAIVVIAWKQTLAENLTRNVSNFLRGEQRV
jgi:hypothetical protein